MNLARVILRCHAVVGNGFPKNSPRNVAFGFSKGLQETKRAVNQNVSVLKQIRHFHASGAHQTYSKANQAKGLKDTILMVAIYGSFAIGAGLFIAIGIKEYNKFKLKNKGIKLLSIKEWGRLKLYSYKGYVLPDFIINQFDDLINFETRSDDVWVVSFPRSGM